MIETTPQALNLSTILYLKPIMNLCRHPDCGKILRMHVPHQKPAKVCKRKTVVKELIRKNNNYIPAEIVRL